MRILTLFFFFDIWLLTAFMPHLSLFPCVPYNWWADKQSRCYPLLRCGAGWVFKPCKPHPVLKPSLTHPLTIIKTQTSFLSLLAQAIQGLLKWPDLLSRDVNYVNNKTFHTLLGCVLHHQFQHLDQTLGRGPSASVWPLHAATSKVVFFLKKFMANMLKMKQYVLILK